MPRRGEADRERARREKKTVGEMISELARRALTTPPEPLSGKEPKAVHGLGPCAPRGGIVTNELIDKLPRQLTDIYLLALAVENEARFVTFDTGVPLGAVRKATMHNLTVL